jgi:FkbM family methyltransferase
MIELRGIPLALYPEGEGVSDMIRASGDFYEATILDFIRDNFPVHRTIVDAGAMIGNHTVYFAAFLEHERIHAFEPVPTSFAMLTVNTVGYSTVVRHHFALSNRKRFLRMTEVPENMGASSVTKRGALKVPAVALDDLPIGPVTFIKIDVEEHEGEVLAGARGIIERDHPLILIEDWTQGARVPQIDGYELVRFWEPHNFLYRWMP